MSHVTIPHAARAVTDERSPRARGRSPLLKPRDSHGSSFFLHARGQVPPPAQTPFARASAQASCDLGATLNSRRGVALVFLLGTNAAGTDNCQRQGCSHGWRSMTLRLQDQAQYCSNPYITSSESRQRGYARWTTNPLANLQAEPLGQLRE